MNRTWLGALVVCVVSTGCVELKTGCDPACAEGLRCAINTMDSSKNRCVIDEAPTISLDAFTGTVSEATRVVSAKVADDVRVVAVEFSADNGQTWLPGTLNDEGTEASGSLSVPALDGKPWSVKARATDSSAQKAEASTTFTVDRVGPVTALVSPTDVVGGLTARVLVTAQDGSGSVATVSIGLDGGASVTATQMGAAWTSTLQLPQDVSGDVFAVASATDEVGNASTQSFTLHVDTIKPTFTLDSANPQVGSAATTITFIASRAVHDVGATWRGSMVSVARVDDTHFTVQLTGPANSQAPLDLAVQGTDAVGNVGASTLSVPVNTDAPTFTLGMGQVIGAAPKTVTFSSDRPVTNVMATWRGASTPVTTVSMTQFSVTIGADPMSSTATAPLILSGTDSRGNMGTTTVMVDTNHATATFTLTTTQAIGPTPRVVTFTSSEPVTNPMATWHGASTPVTTITSTSFSVTIGADPMSTTTMEPLTVSGTNQLGNTGGNTLQVPTTHVPPTFTLDMGQVIGPTPKVVTFTSNRPVTFPTAMWRTGSVMVTTLSPTSFSVLIGADSMSTATSAPLTLSGTDALGNTGGNTVMVTTDLTKATFTLTAGQVIGPTPKVVTFTTNRPVTNPTATWRGNPATVTPMGPATSFSVTIGADANNPATSVPLELSGTDALGNVGGNTVMVTTDTTKPTFALAPANQVVGPTPRAVTFTSNRRVSNVTASWRGQPEASMPTSGTNFTLTLSHNVLGTTTSNATLTGVDDLGNVGTSAVAVPVDTVPPTVNITNPTLDAIVGGPDGGVLTVTISSSDGTNPSASVAVTFNNTTLPATASGNTWTTSFPMPTNLDYVSRPLSATATDAVGNTATSSISVFVDNVAPRPTMTGFTGGQRFNIAQVMAAGGSIPVSFAAVDGDAVLSGKTAIKATTVFGADMASPVPGSFSVTPRSTDNPFTYSVRVRVLDRAGNQGELIRDFDVDMVRPTIVATSPANGTVTVDPRRATVTFSEPMAATAAAISTTPTSGMGTWLSPTQYATTTLAGDSIYTASFDVVTDLFLNPVNQFPNPVQFRTAPAIPAPFSVIATDVAAFEAVSDVNGQALIATVSASAQALKIAELDVTTGQLGTTNLYPRTPFSPGDFGLSLSSWTTFSGTTKTTHRIGLAVQGPLGGGKSHRIDTWENGVQVTNNNFADTHVVLPPSTDITSQTGTLGFINDAADYNRGSAMQSIKLTAVGTTPLMVTSPWADRWLALYTNGTGTIDYLHVNRVCQSVSNCPYEFEYGSAFNGSFSFSQPLQSNWINRWRVSMGLASDGSCLAFASSRDAFIVKGLAYSANGTCPGCTFTPSRAGTNTEVNSYDTRIIVASLTGGFIGLGFTSTDCASVTPFGTQQLVDSRLVLTSAQVRTFKPIKLGGRPALLFISDRNELMVAYE